MYEKKSHVRTKKDYNKVSKICMHDAEYQSKISNIPTRSSDLK